MSVEIAYIELDQPELVTDRRHAQLVRECLREEAEFHLRKTLGDHFKKNSKTAVGGAYGYHQRGRKYLERKLRRGGGDTPWLWTGHSRNYIRNNSRITATQNRARLYLKNRWPMQDQMRSELQALAPEEIVAMQTRTRDRYVAKLNDPANQRKRRRRI